MQLGQFFAARAEFVPEPICRKLSLLHDRVGPCRELVSPLITPVVISYVHADTSPDIILTEHRVLGLESCC